MTSQELLAAIHSHTSHFGEEAERLFLPDIYPFVQPSLQSLARRLKGNKELSPLLLTKFTVSVTSATPSGGVFSGNIPSDMLIDPPYLHVYLGGKRVLFSRQPIAGDTCGNLTSPYYTVVGTTIKIFYPGGFETSPQSLEIHTTRIPPLADLPIELNGQFIDEVLIRLGLVKREGVRK